jgi:hypothetical protein
MKSFPIYPGNFASQRDAVVYWDNNFADCQHPEVIFARVFFSSRVLEATSYLLFESCHEHQKPSKGKYGKCKEI